MTTRLTLLINLLLPSELNLLNVLFSRTSVVSISLSRLVIFF